MSEKAQAGTDKPSRIYDTAEAVEFFAGIKHRAKSYQSNAAGAGRDPAVEKLAGLIAEMADYLGESAKLYGLGGPVSSGEPAPE